MSENKTIDNTSDLPLLELIKAINWELHLFHIVEVLRIILIFEILNLKWDQHLDQADIYMADPWTEPEYKYAGPG